jgi:hypothetical protein
MTEMDCQQLRDCSAELALGALSGAERASALMHLEHCLDCQNEIKSLSTVSDALSDFVPSMEPPVGFETRVVARLRGQGVGDRWPRAQRLAGRRWWPAAAAALVLVAGATGWVIGDASRSSPPSPAPRVAFSWGSFRSPGRPGDIGEAFISWGRPRWVFMAVDLGSGDGIANCFLMEKGGHLLQVGSFDLSHGFGYWGAAIQAPVWQVTGARIESTDGRILATATFS